MRVGFGEAVSDENIFSGLGPAGHTANVGIWALHLSPN